MRDLRCTLICLLTNQQWERHSRFFHISRSQAKVLFVHSKNNAETISRIKVFVFDELTHWCFVLKTNRYLFSWLRNFLGGLMVNKWLLLIKFSTHPSSVMFSLPPNKHCRHYWIKSCFFQCMSWFCRYHDIISFVHPVIVSTIGSYLVAKYFVFLSQGWLYFWHLFVFYSN